MSAAKDDIGISSIGVQSIAPTTATSWRVTKRKPDGNRKPEDDHDTDGNARKANPVSPSPGPPGIGRLVDKAV